MKLNRDEKIFLVARELGVLLLRGTRIGAGCWDPNELFVRLDGVVIDVRKLAAVAVDTLDAN